MRSRQVSRDDGPKGRHSRCEREFDLAAAEGKYRPIYVKMSNVGERERLTQGRVVAYFRDTLKYRCLESREYRDGNSTTSKRSGSPTGSRIGP